MGVAHMRRMNRCWSSVLVSVLAVMFFAQTLVGQDGMRYEELGPRADWGRLVLDRVMGNEPSGCG